MATKYKFNPETFSYQNDNKLVRYSKIILTQIVAIVFLSIAVFYALSYFQDSPLEKNLKYENQILEKEYNRIYALYDENEKNLQQLEQQDEGLYKLIFGAPMPVDSSANIINKINTTKPKVLVKNNYENLLELQNYLSSTKQEFISFVDSFQNIINSSDNIPSIQPVPNPNLQLLIYGYGYRLDPIYHTPRFHKGIDFNVPIGTPVVATANGKVTKSGRATKVQGIIVEIEHGDYSTHYYHLNDVNVRVGQTVERGQVIGYAGTTGKSLIPHLHYEIFYKNKPVNPIFFFFLDLTPQDFNTIYKKSITAGISLD
ncbi:MAG: M23 family metallopeptidase [Bacteroidales bacterium]|nr:M23 family metallopeptidase [Bacteroidales bacterium]